MRILLGFLALGSGLVHVALVIGSPPPVAIVLLLVGAAEFVWGALAVARPSPPVPRFACAAAFVPVIAWALLLIVAGRDSLGPLTSSTQLLPMLVASFFDLLVAGGLTVMLRRGGTAPTGIATPSSRRLIAVIVGGVLIAAITAPALATTEAGHLAGTPGSSFDGTTGHDH